MTFHQAVQNAMAAWFADGIADTITYNGTDIPAHVEYGSQETDNAARTAVITVRTSDVAAPGYRDTIVINGATWRVYQDRRQEVIIEGDGHTWKIPVRRAERPGGIR